MMTIKLISITTDKSLRNTIKSELNYAHRIYSKNIYLFGTHMRGFYKGLLEANKINLDRYTELCLKIDSWIWEKERNKEDW